MEPFCVVIYPYHKTIANHDPFARWVVALRELGIFIYSTPSFPLHGRDAWQICMHFNFRRERGMGNFQNGFKFC